jgi:hypothetical protein
MCAHRAGGHSRRRLRFPESTPPRLNHSIPTGTLIDDPRLARSPADEPIILLAVEFPVADPERPQMLWTWASCEIEVPGCARSAARHPKARTRRIDPHHGAAQQSVDDRTGTSRQARRNCRGPGPPWTSARPGGVAHPGRQTMSPRPPAIAPPTDALKARFARNHPLPRGDRHLAGRARLPCRPPPHRDQPAGARRAHSARRYRRAARRQPRRSA